MAPSARRTAPPDANIKAYVYTDMVSPLLWMNTAPGGQTAAMATSGARLETVADLPPPGGSSAQYGPLWAHVKAVACSTYLASPVEPTSAYCTSATSVWSNLYNGQTAKSSYPETTPYRSTGVNLAKPDPAHAPGVRNRRILNVPLLDCSATPGSSDARSIHTPTIASALFAPGSAIRKPLRRANP